jgi:hypothetical protein
MVKMADSWRNGASWASLCVSVNSRARTSFLYYPVLSFPTHHFFLLLPSTPLLHHIISPLTIIYPQLSLTCLLLPFIMTSSPFGTYPSSLPDKPHSKHSAMHHSIVRPRRHSLRRYIDSYIPADEATASSAVRNLSSVEVNGRQLRVEASTDEPGPRSRQEGSSGGGGGGGQAGGAQRMGGGRARDDTPPRRYGGAPGGGPGYPPIGMGGGPPPLAMGGASAGSGMGDQPPRVDLGLLPPGVDMPPSMGKTTDAISKTLAAVSPGQMQDVMAGMKVSIEAISQQLIQNSLV